MKYEGNFCIELTTFSKHSMNDFDTFLVGTFYTRTSFLIHDKIEVGYVHLVDIFRILGTKYCKLDLPEGALLSGMQRS